MNFFEGLQVQLLDTKYIGWMVNGWLMTVWMSLLVVVVSMLLGLLLAAARSSSRAPLARICA